MDGARGFDPSAGGHASRRGTTAQLRDRAQQGGQAFARLPGGLVREGRRIGGCEISSVIMRIEELHAQPNWVLRIVADDGRVGNFDVSPYLEYEAFDEIRDH